MKIEVETIQTMDVMSEGFFSFSGCENCANGLGNDVYETKCFFSDGMQDHFEINLCHNCIYQFYYGDAVKDTDCNDVFGLWEA